MNERNETEGYVAGRQGQSTGGSSQMTNLLEQVQRETTIAGGLTKLRSGIAGVLASGLGPTITQDGYSPNAGGDGDGGGITTQALPDDSNVAELSALYQSLVIDNDEWADALIANTPMAETTGQEHATQSRSAFA